MSWALRERLANYGNIQILHAMVQQISKIVKILSLEKISLRKHWKIFERGINKNLHSKPSKSTTHVRQISNCSLRIRRCKLHNHRNWIITVEKMSTDMGFTISTVYMSASSYENARWCLCTLKNVSLNILSQELFTQMSMPLVHVQKFQMSKRMSRSPYTRTVNRMSFVQVYHDVTEQ